MVKLRYEQRRPWWRRSRWIGVIAGICVCFYAAVVPWPSAISSVGYVGQSVQMIFGSALVWAQDVSHGWWQSEASELRLTLLERDARIQRLTVELEELRHQLREHKAFMQHAEYPTVTARVTQHILIAPHQTMTINVGELEGVAVGDPVVSSAGLLGRVERTAQSSAVVLLLTDPTHSVDVRLQNSRARAILQGAGRGLTLGRQVGVSRIEYVQQDSGVSVGDVVVTSGLDGRYPVGLPVGHVQHVRMAEDKVFASADVTPFADWHAPENVQVILLSPQDQT